MDLNSSERLPRVWIEFIYKIFISCWIVVGICFRIIPIPLFRSGDLTKRMKQLDKCFIWYIQNANLGKKDLVKYSLQKRDTGLLTSLSLSSPYRLNVAKQQFWIHSRLSNFWGTGFTRLNFFILNDLIVKQNGLDEFRGLHGSYVPNIVKICSGYLSSALLRQRSTKKEKRSPGTEMRHFQAKWQKSS